MSKSLSICLLLTGFVLIAGCDDPTNSVVNEKPQTSPFNTLPLPAPAPPVRSANTAKALTAKVSILNKAELAKVAAGDELNINFEVSGVNASDVMILCRTGKAEEFFTSPSRPCSGATSHKVGKLDAGTAYAFSVEVVAVTTKQKLSDDAVSILVSPPTATIKVELALAGAEKLSEQTTGTIALVATVEGMSNLSFVCKVNGTVVPCEGGKLNLDLGSYSGQSKLEIEALGTNGIVIAARETPFCAGSCGQKPLDIFVADEFGLDGNYIIHLPPEMHLLSYSTNRGFDATMVNTLAVMTDPLFPPQPCGDITPEHSDTFNPGRLVSLASGAGKVHQYCQRAYAQPEAYKLETGEYKAFNSIEFSTDAPNPQAAAQSPQGAYERFSFNHFGTNVESMLPVSRFYSLCQKNYGAGAPVVRIVNNFYGEGAFTQVNYCKTLIQNQFGRPVEVWVAGLFFNKLDGLTPSALEMTYIATAGVLPTAFRDDIFIRQAVLRVRSIVESTGLNERYMGWLGY